MRKITIENTKSIRHLEFTLPEQKGVYLLVGANGAGKTTLLVCLDRICNPNGFARGFSASKSFGAVDQYGVLPEYYLSKADAKELGWKAYLGNLSEIAPGMMIGGDVYQNRNGHLPQVEGRIWYEADINYVDGYRTRHRILYSNDGLVFVTYDHYETFYEIT